MNIFRKKDHKPRIAYRLQRNGVKRYYVESWGYFGGCRPDYDELVAKYQLKSQGGKDNGRTN